ncbi:T9SS type B sorting domain-containing protein [Marixanthomonas spongiae]|uniref:Ig-like domain-containing protein n=1 Tax=Marixanthomonas spongiae TaxID=2174845 RepID=A0A2U0I452_9FLAO|nr:T9SS type B sorting domain-containing protein [Marixanthomonas spongiae]PVW15887.1 hypothetical protein DDV96_06375 [Marixanthomonas spongiae]
MTTSNYLHALIILVFSLIALESTAQNYEPFTPTYDNNIKGDIMLIGNNILNRDTNSADPNDPYNGTNNYNSDFDMQYIDIDGDPTTFSSSSAVLEAPSSCYNIVYAGLYWGAIYQESDRSPITNIKLKMPEGGYHDLTGEVVYDAYGNPIGGDNSTPYACYADVTSLVQSLSDPAGTYTVGNVTSSLGYHGGTGLSSGWSLFVVYEDPLLPGKAIVSFDGFSAIGGATTLDVPVAGFRTIPVGPVRAKFAFSALEGDFKIKGDYLRINGNTMSTPQRATNNFFNSKVTTLNGNYTNRTPNSGNTLGFDAGILNVPNPGNSVIANGDTSATIRLGSTQDVYFYYFNAFAVDIIQPDILLTKNVENTAGVNINNGNVTLGQELDYVIGFQNLGNDDAIDFSIRDVLPINVNYQSVDVSNAPGVTYTYDPVNFELNFDVPDNLVEEGDPAYEIRIRVKVIEDCNQLRDACSNVIQNLAYATYSSETAGNVVANGDPSVSGTNGCGTTVPGSTNFLVNVDGCTFERDEVLCGSEITLTAGNGYIDYKWYEGDETTGTLIGTTQSITVSNPGLYTCVETAPAPCVSVVETVNVTLFGTNIPNPILPYANNIVTCPTNGEELPELFLCGANDSRLIETNITDATSIVWEKLNEGSCSAAPQDCPNTSATCTWNQVGTGPNFNVDQAGQYRLRLNYQNGCFKIFHFNVYQNLFQPTETHRDIICNTNGEIQINGVPSGYEFSINGPGGPYQASNIFPITTAGVYTVHIKPTGVPNNPCIFTVPDIPIRERDFSVDVIAGQPLCAGDKGSISVQMNDVRPQYYYELVQGGSVINSVGPIPQSDYTFNNLNDGTYTINTSTDDGCTYTEDITITSPDPLTVTAALTQPLTCEPGEITIYPVGGTAPYFYYINSTTDFQTVPEYEVTAPGVYNITVVDNNNCSATTQIEVEQTPNPEYTITHTDALCNGSNDGTITINTTNNHGYSMEYSIDGGMTFTTTGTFTGLAPGSYNVVVQYSLGGAVCTDTDTVEILEATPISATTEIVQDYTCSDLGVIQTINVSGGTPPYQYSLDGTNFQTSNVFTGLSNGSYTVTVKDANGCTFTTNTVILDDLNPPTDLSFTSTAVTCPNVNADVTVTTTGGNAPFTYEIVSPISVVNGTDPVFTNLAPGTYTFKVTDSKNCSYEEAYTIDAIDFINVTGQVQNNVDCFGSSTGNGTFTVTGFTASYSYSIDGSPLVTGQTNNTIPLGNVAAGTYTINVTDETTQCTATTTLTIEEPDSALLDDGATVSPITCVTDGSVLINASGGWGSYQYTLTQPDASVLGPQTNNDFSSLIQTGTYTYTIEDLRGCTVSGTFNLTAPDIPVATVGTTSDLCFDPTSGATIVVDATNGVPPYTYSLNGGPFQTNNTFTGLTPGNYTVEVRDSYGCTSAAVSEVIAPQLLVDAVLTKGLDCTVNPDAEITATITGGTPAFTYQVSYNSGGYGAPTAVTGNSFTYTTPNDGTYTFRITDAIGCTVESSIVTVNPLPVLDSPAVTVSQGISCFGDETGALDIVPSGGLPPYSINVLNTTTGTDYGNQTTGLAAGNYVITVTDANSCTQTATITITQPDEINFILNLVDITCGSGGTSLGSIAVQNVTGGTQEYTYYLSNNFGYSANYTTTAGGEDHTFLNLEYGIYQLEVIDANGCSKLQSNIIIASPPDDLDIDVTTLTTDCSTGGTAIVTVNPIIPSNNYEFGIVDMPGFPYSSAYQPADTGFPRQSTFTGLTPGVIYTFVVHDLDTDCYYFETATAPIDTPSNLTAVLDTINNVTCTGAADGNVTFTIDNYDAGATAVDYEIFNSLNNTTTGISGTITPLSGGPETVSNVGPLAPGNYYLLFNEVGGTFNGCSSTSTPFDIIESTNQLELDVLVTKNDNCNLNAGVITATGQYGTPPYEFQLNNAGDPAPTIATWTGGTSNVFNVEGGNYEVYIKDAFGCIVMEPIFMPTDTSPEITLALNPSTVCNPEGTFEVIVTRTAGLGIAPYTYSVDGSGFTTYVEDAFNSFVLSGLNSGTHTVIIKDANGCEYTETIDILPPLNAITATSISTTPDCGVSDGIIEVLPSGGSGDYSYGIAPFVGGMTQTGNLFENVPAGSYVVTVTDNITGCTFDVNAVLEAPNPPTFNTVPSDVTCNGGSDGSIEVNLTGSNTDPVYTYEISAPITVGPQTTNVFSGLAAGTYTVAVTSGRNCIATQDVTIGEPAAIIVPTPTVTQFECSPGTNTSNNATIAVTGVSGGSGTFVTYEFIKGGTVLQTGSNNTYIESDRTGGTYTINVYDTNGCVGTTTAVINPFVELSDPLVTVTTPYTCTNLEEITVTVSTTGGTPGTLEYTVLGLGGNPYNVTQTLPDFTGLTIGNYQVLVTNLDTGCVVETVHSVEDPDTFIIVPSLNNNVTCLGASDGSIDFTFVDQDLNPTDDAGPFNYTVTDSGGSTVATGTSPNAGPITVNGLPAGTFTFTATLINNPFCTVSVDFVIEEPTAALALSVGNTDITCIASSDDGTITATASDGWGAPYEYQLELGATTISAWSSVNYFTNLSAGTYTVRARDSNGCVVSVNETLTNPVPISADISAIPSSLPCYNDANATITISNVTGGQGNGYLYTLIDNTTGTSSGPQANAMFTNIPAGTYHAEITDGWGCTFTTPDVTITQPNEAATGILSMVSPPSCANDAVLHIDAFGGTPPYEYSEDGVTYVPLTAGNAITVGPGTYQYFVRDANGCAATVTNSIEVLPVLPVTINLDLSGAVISCFGGANASIVATANNGVGNYMYELIDEPTGTVIQGPQSSGTFNDLPSGTYRVNVTSGPDCAASSNVITITDPEALIADYSKNNISCFGQQDGSITINASGGTGVLQYAISPNLDQFQEEETFSGLGAGTYEVIVQDQNGCYEVFTIEIIEPPLLEASLGPINDELCLNEGDGSITVDITGGSGSYLISLDNTNFIPVTGNQHTFTGLQGDTFYQIFVEDTNGCAINPPLEYYMPPAVEVIPSVSFEEECNNNNPITIVTIDVNPQVENDVEYSLDNVNYTPNNVFSGLAPGNYTAYVRHTNGCTEEIDFTVDQLLPIDATAQVTQNVLCFGEATGEIEVTATNGTAPLEYAISPNYVFGSNNTFSNLPAGTYTVLVRDAISCEVSIDNLVITQPDEALSATVNPTGETCLGASDGSVDITVLGGTAPYFTSIDGINYTQDQFTYTGLNGGQQYTMYVKDVNDCNITPINFTIDVGVDIQASAEVENNCNNNLPGNIVTVEVNASVIDDVQYSIDGINYTPANTFTNLAPGNYTAYVQHTNGCIDTDDFVIEALDPIDATAAVTQDVLCFGDATGEIEVTTISGSAPFEYAISPDFNFGTNPVFSGLEAGTYTILVRDALGCQFTIDNNVISQPDEALSASVNPTGETCLGASDGSVDITVLGGTAPYFTSIDGINYTQDQFTYTGLAGGQQYTLYVKDANNCNMEPVNFTIDPGVEIMADVDVAYTCTSNVTGNTVTINVDNSVVNEVEYSINGTDYFASDTFYNLLPGNYTAYVLHNNGCIDTEDFVIDSLQPVTATVTSENVLCNGDASGSIEVEGFGGLNNFTYGISPDFNMTPNNQFTNLTAGTYTVRAMDETGCYAEETVTIEEPTAIDATVVAVFQEICVDDDNGAIEIAVSGGTPPYATSLNDESNYVSDRFTFNNLDGGQTYTIFIQDANGCVSTLDVTLEDPVDIDAVAAVDYSCTENMVTVTVDSSVVDDVTYHLDGGAGQTDNVFTNLSAGEHTIDVIHPSGCFDSVTFTIEEIEPLAIDIEETDLNQITVLVTGGSGVYTYFFNDEDYGSNNVYTYYQDETITVRVIDENGCEIESAIEVVFIDITIPNAFTPDGTSTNDTWTPQNTENYPNIKTSIYDRHGREVAVLRQGEAWDGTYNNRHLPTGDYWYIIQLGSAADNREFVGHFTLYR